MSEFIDIMADCFFTEYEENIAYDKAEKAIIEHDKQIRAEVIDEVKQIIHNIYTADAIVNIINTVTEYMYCNWKVCHMKENMTWEDLQKVREEIKENAMDMIKGNLDYVTLALLHTRLEQLKEQK